MPRSANAVLLPILGVGSPFRNTRISVVRLVRQEGGERKRSPQPPPQRLHPMKLLDSESLGICDDLGTHTHEGGSTNPRWETAHPSQCWGPPATCPTLQRAPPPGRRATGTTQLQQPRPRSLADKMKPQTVPWAQAEGSPRFCRLPPLAGLHTGISENGFHNSVSGNQLFTTWLPTDSQPVTVSEIISGPCPTALL